MNAQLMVLSVLLINAFAGAASNARILNVVERDVQDNMQAFNDLSKSISISDLSDAIVSRDARMLKDSLQDVMELNTMVNNQVNAAIQLWNIYLDSVKIPTMETYLLGQVINALITTVRALTLRSSVDQSMIFSLVKKQFARYEEADESDFSHLVDARGSRVENKWKLLRQE